MWGVWEATVGGEGVWTRGETWCVHPVNLWTLWAVIVVNPLAALGVAGASAREVAPMTATRPV